MFTVTKDGVKLFTDESENACYVFLQKYQGQSAEYAFKYGGFRIEEVK